VTTLIEWSTRITLGDVTDIGKARVHPALAAAIADSVVYDDLDRFQVLALPDTIAALSARTMPDVAARYRAWEELVDAAGRRMKYTLTPEDVDLNDVPAKLRHPVVYAEFLDLLVASQARKLVLA
jgi:hypothetical protein